MDKIMLKLSSVSLMAFTALCVVPGCVGPESNDELGWADAKDGEAVTLSGTVVVMNTMHETHDESGVEGQDELGADSCAPQYYLRRDPRDGAPLRLEFDGQAPPIQTGDEISVEGIWHANSGEPSLAVEKVLSTAKPAADSSEGEFGQTDQGIVTARAPKKHKIAVFLLGNTTTTVAQAKAMIDAYSPDSAAAFIGENSGLVDTFEGKVLSYPDINTAGCKFNEADVWNRFEAEGNKINDYTNLAYVIAGGGCGFVATGTINRPGSSDLAMSWYNDTAFTKCSIVAHELGHNLGFEHSGSTECGSALYKASRQGCTDDEYGNKLDMMGISGNTCIGRGHYGIVHKRYAGYLSKCEDVTAGGSAVFRLSAAEGSCGMRSLRIPIAGENNYYYLEFRKQGAGEFAGIAGESRVLLNVSNDPPAGTSPMPFLLDATPATSVITDAWLAVGTTYSLPGGVSIRVESIGEVAKIKVTMPAGAGAKCQDGSTPPSSGGVIGGLCGAIADKTYQAENNTYQKSCTKSTSQPSYNGTGYMDFGGAGSIVELGDVDVPRYGSYKLTFRYANGTATNKTSKIAVNGQPVGTLAFSSTGGWSTWKTATINATLKKGINRIRVTSVAEGPNLDQVLISAN